MRALSTSKMLSVWERASGRSAVERALVLLAAACPEQTLEELARLSIGRRDRLLLSLRESTFGPQLLGRIPCQKCGEALELSFKVSDICVPESLTVEAQVLKLDGYEIQFRLPDSLDLSAISGCADVAEGYRLLLTRCLLSITEGDEPGGSEDLPEHVREAVVKRMAEADPQGNVQLRLSCPACGHHWLAAFDILSYFWSEINAWAHRILREVHTLAVAYGWSEEEILVMTPRRRRIYLEMIGG